MRLRLPFVSRLSRRWSIIIVTIVVVAISAGGGGYALFFGGSNGPAANSGSINLNKGLVGWWKMDGNANDSTPYGDNGTLAGATPPALTTNREGKANSAYGFNGTTSAFDVTTASYQYTSICGWANTAAIGSIQGIFSGPSPAQINFYIDAAGYYYFYTTNTDATRTNIKSSVAITANTWHLVCAVLGSGSRQLYLDGQVVASDTKTASAVALNAIGAVGAYYWNGSIDDVRLYNRALSPAEVTALYKQYDPATKTAQGESGLVGWWKFDGNAKDASPYANDLTNNSVTLTADRKGNASSAYSFNGTTSYLQAAAPNLNFSNSFTISFWMNSTSTNNNFTGLIDKVNISATSVGWDLGMQNGFPRMALRGTTSNIDTGGVTGNSLYDGNWHYITVVCTTTSINIYVDNVLKKTTTGSWSVPTTTTNPLQIGQREGNGSFYSGVLDDVRIYNHALSPSDIATQYSSYNSQISLGGSGQAGSVSLQKGLIGYWPMNGNLKDATPYGDTGTNNSATATTDRRGRANSAYNLNGSTSSDIRIPDSAQLDSATSQFTFSGWFKWTNSSSNWLFGKTSNPVSYGWYIYSDNYFSYGIQFSVYNGSTTPSQWSSTYVPSSGVWHNVVVTFSSGTATLFVDGALVSWSGHTGGVATIGVNNQPLVLGNFYGAGYSFNGSLDDIRVYNRVLNAAEAQALYRGYQ